MFRLLWRWLNETSVEIEYGSEETLRQHIHQLRIEATLEQLAARGYVVTGTYTRRDGESRAVRSYFEPSGTLEQSNLLFDMADHLERHLLRTRSAAV